MNIWIIVVVCIIGFIVLAIGGGIGYWLWIASRPKKMTWNAMVWQVGDATIKHDEEGKIINQYELAELIPYTEDIIEKVDKKNGATHYWLQKMKKATPVVTADCVNKWTNNKKIVNVLLDGDTCTLLKFGYDKKLARLIFRPMPHDRLNMINTETAERKVRIEDTKDILSQIFPYISLAIFALAIVVVAYFNAQAGIKIAEYNDLIDQRHIELWEGEAMTLLKAHGIYIPEQLEDNSEVQKEEPPSIPP
jgi:hypothetical protein